ncbi:glycosyltransferase [Azohydromonas lata]|uniref:glycosyltransferase n=1 Tax=Azohydromonas lata TaxID=45677 RepID=UPI000A041130|nr:glycosyltransferase [Azohydromonas lata]
MKIAMLSSASGGGAGIAAKRLSDAFNQLPGIDCDFIEATLMGGIPESVIYPGSASNRMLTDTHFTGEHCGFVRQWIVDFLMQYDVINVQWASFLVTTAEIAEVAKTGKPVFITMHDFFYSTGGCHYQAGCMRQKSDCAACPQVNTSVFSKAAVVSAFKEKQSLLSLPNVFISAPSKHVVSRVLAAGLSDSNRTRVIRNVYVPAAESSTDTGNTHTDASRVARVMIIADSLSERRKNSELGFLSVALFAELFGNVELHLVGRASPGLVESKSRIKVVRHGHISDQARLAALYQKCDVILTCSSEDNWPNVLVEASAYGLLPVVGPNHGCEEFVRYLGLDFVAEDYSKESFAEQLVRAIHWRRKNGSELPALVERVRCDHAIDKITSEFIDFFSQTASSRGEISMPVQSVA